MILKTNFIGLLTVLVGLLFAPLSYSQTDTLRKENPKKETRSKLFEESATDSDYLMAIEKASAAMETAFNDADFDGASHHLFGEIKRTQSKLDLILNSLKGANPNARNQQMYRIVLK